LAILAGLLELIPNLGPTIAAIPAIIIAFATHGVVSGSAVTVMALMIQQLENNYLVPKIMSSTAKVSPLVVILLILMGSQLAGISGALLAVPLYIMLRSWYSFYHAPKLSS
jgi:predicted PurR-regulated permease PerM